MSWRCLKRSARPNGRLPPMFFRNARTSTEKEVKRNKKQDNGDQGEDRADPDDVVAPKRAQRNNKEAHGDPGDPKTIRNIIEILVIRAESMEIPETM